MFNAFLIAGVIAIGNKSFDEQSFIDRGGRKGLANGATYAAYVRFPTSFSNCLNCTLGDFSTNSIRFKYFLTFFSDNLHTLEIESYTKPSITIICAGPRHFSLFSFAPVRSPTANNRSNINFAFRLSLAIPNRVLFGPPKKSSI